MRSFALRVLAGDWAVCRLAPDVQWQTPTTEKFWSITRTADELSLVVPAEIAPKRARVEKGWCILQVQGPLEFDIVGVMAELTRVIARVEVSLFALSTFDTDYILVQRNFLEKACGALVDAGHSVEY